MPSIHEIQEDDPDVPAGNIAGTHWKEGRCYYDGRPQGPKLAAESQEDLIKTLTEKQREIIRDQGSVADYIYPDNDAWELRIF